jgi:hypothetical protein
MGWGTLVSLHSHAERFRQPRDGTTSGQQQAWPHWSDGCGLAMRARNTSCRPRTEAKKQGTACLQAIGTGQRHDDGGLLIICAPVPRRQAQARERAGTLLHHQTARAAAKLCRAMISHPWLLMAGSSHTAAVAHGLASRHKNSTVGDKVTKAGRVSSRSLIALAGELC